MLKIKINYMSKIKRKSWADVKVSEYYDIMEVLQSTILTDLEKQVGVYAVLSGLSEDEIDNIPFNKFRNIIQEDYPFFAEDLPSEQYIPTDYIIGGKKFKMMKNPSDMTTIQYADMDTLLKQDDNNNLHILAALLFIPKGKKYGTYDINEQIDFFYDNLTMDIANNLTSFFFRYMTNATAYYMGALQKETRKEMNKEMKKKNPNMVKVLKMQDFLVYTPS